MNEIRLSSEDIQNFKELFNHDSFCIYMHRSPDGDTVGTAFALRQVLLNAGKKVTLACSDEVGKRLLFLTDGKSSFTPEFEAEYHIAVDLASPQLLGKKYEDFAENIDLCIDHHYTNTKYAKKTVLLSDASSAGETLCMLLEQSGVEIDEKIAYYLYAAISFDTGCFKFSNVRPNTHLIAGKLLSYGFDAAEINRRLFDLAPMKQLLLEKEVIDNIRLYLDGKIALCCITGEMLDKVGLSDEEADGMTSVVRRVDGSLASVTMRQFKTGEIRISLRSECDFDVSKVAAVFGGGGHKRASGCSIKAEPEVAIEKIIDVIKKEWENTFK